VFITRMAVLLGGKAKLTKTKAREYNSVVERLEDIIRYWFDHASKFYTQQTVDHPFKVYIVYSKCYESIVRSFTFPKWCELVEYKHKNIDRVNSIEYYSKYNNQPVSISRIDADDWYSDDYFDYLSSDCELTDPGRNLTTHLHKWLRLYNRQTGEISLPQHFSSPGFATNTFKPMDTSQIPMHLSLWPHGNIKRSPHITPSNIFCMQSVGCNVVNKWRFNTRPEKDIGSVSNFYIPK
jgi:hypothetical protein